MQKGVEASVGCFQGESFIDGRPCPRCLNGYILGPKEANGLKQANAVSEDGAVNSEKLAVPGECFGRQLQNENCCSWPVFPGDIQEGMHSHSRPFVASFSPVNHGQLFPIRWIPQVPLEMLPQRYPPEYAIQNFQYFVVIDFEATCDKEKNPHPQEIIEFPSVLVNSRTGLLEDCFQKYVRPTYNKHLTEFCKKLTGIHQSQVDNGVSLSEALLMHDKWLEDRGVKHTNFAVVTWSNWDCQVMLESECRFKRMRKPPYFNRWINLKVPFCEVFGGVRCNLKEAVELAGVTWKGRAHCGLDDAKNTARLLAHLMHRGFKFSITNSLMSQSTEYPHVIPQQVPTPPKYSIACQPQNWKISPCSSPAHFQPTQFRNPVKDHQVRCYCGVTSIKFQKPGIRHGSFFYGCGNWTANRGAHCSFYKWAPTSDFIETAPMMCFG